MWLIESLVSIIKRAKTYNKFIKQANYYIMEEKLLNENLSDIITKLILRSLVSFEVERAYSKKQGIFLVVRKNPETLLVKEDKLMIVDDEDKVIIIGVFSIIRINQDNYYALAAPGLDPIWAGYVSENKEVKFFPYIKAYFITEGDNYGN